MLPDQIAEWVRDLPRHRLAVVYCTCHNEATSARAAQQLQYRGFDAVALKGGIETWRKLYPTEPTTVEEEGAYPAAVERA